jgi:hypothetical protein
MIDKIVVSSNCQTGGLAAALKAIFPNFEVRPFALPNANDNAKADELMNELRSARIWVTSGSYSMAEDLTLKLIKVPQVAFYAFHPDLCYAKNTKDATIISPGYNSKIAVWAFNKNLDIKLTAKLFNPRVYKALGYYDAWYQNEMHLKGLLFFSGYSEDEFHRFFLYLKRHGSFMYSINHPRPNLLVELGKLVASKILNDKSYINREIIIPDGLTDTIWPLYPEIGESLGLVGEYVWRFANRDIIGVLNYVKYAFDNYNSLGLIPGNLQAVEDNLCPALNSSQDAFLSKEIGL